MKKSILGVALFSLSAFSATAFAVPTHTFNFEGNDFETSAAGGRSFNSTPAGETVIVRAFAADNDGNGKLSQQTLAGWAGNGLGVKTGNESSPNHAVDNDGRDEVLIFEFDEVFMADSFHIGWKENDADIRIWMGGDANSNINFSNVCLTGTCSGGSTLASLGFQSVLFTNVNVDVIQTIAGLSGKYLIIEAESSADSKKDYFKVGGLGVKSTTRVPEPASLSLIGLGVAGLIAARRRKA